MFNISMCVYDGIVKWVYCDFHDNTIVHIVYAVVRFFLFTRTNMTILFNIEHVHI